MVCIGVHTHVRKVRGNIISKLQFVVVFVNSFYFYLRSFNIMLQSYLYVIVKEIETDGVYAQLKSVTPSILM